MKLTPADRLTFAQKFYDFGDALVSSVTLDMRDDAEAWRCTLVIECRDPTFPNGRLAVRFVIHGVREFRLQEYKGGFSPISFGVKFYWRDGLLYFLLNEEPEDDSFGHDLDRNVSFLAGESCDWFIEESSSFID